MDLPDRLSRLSGQDAFGILLLGIIVALVLDLFRRLATGDLPPGTLGTFLWRGLLDGVTIGLAAIGLSMTYSILRFPNFAHGDLLTAGAFSGWTVAYLVGGVGLADFSSRLLLRADGAAPPGVMEMDIVRQPLAIVLGLVFAALMTIAVALFFDRFVFKKMRDARNVSLLIASVGVALALRYAIAFLYTGQRRGLIASPPQYSPDFLGGMTINLHEMTMVVSAIVLIVGVHVLLQYTKLGKSMRAMADNKDLALITGIPTERVITATWTVGAGLAGVAGYLVVLDRGTLSFNLGWFLLLLVFAAVILGGIGSIYGAILGSLIIGLAINVSLVWIPNDLNEVAAFALMITILIYKPEGLLGGVKTA